MGRNIGKRLSWLVILLGLGLSTSSVVDWFGPVAARLNIVVNFYSLILDMSGNAGTQSLVVTIRGSCGRLSGSVQEAAGTVHLFRVFVHRVGTPVFRGPLQPLRNGDSHFVQVAEG